MGFLTGKSAKKQGSSQSQSTSVQDSRSFNNYWPQAQQDFGSTAGMTGSATNALFNLLGMGGDASAQNAAFDNFRNNTGYQFGLNQGTNAITGSAASKGLLNSGSTLKALNQFGQDYASTKYNDYLSHLFNLAQQGLSAGQLLGNVGQESTSHGESQATSSSNEYETKGKGGILGPALSLGASLIPSDRRLKNSIRFIRTMDNGLNIYEYKYKSNPNKTFVGVMADEVQKLVPEALGPETEDGYLTVDYSKIPDFPEKRIY